MGWITRWRTEVWSDPVRPGIWKRRKGGFVLVTSTHLASGRRQTWTRTIEACPTGEAQRAFDEFRREKLVAASGGSSSRTLFATFATSLFRRKVAARDIRSAKGVEKWRDILKNHLIPAFGETPMGALRHGALARWRADLAERVAAPERDANGRRNPKHLSPRTCNTIFSVLAVITKAATIELDLERDPFQGLANFSTAEHPTYTDESPNALNVRQVRAFLAKMRDLYPQHYAMAYLGFATGLRPSSLRPIRRSGPFSDIVWEADGTAVLRVRRSHSLGNTTMGSNKTGRWQTIHLPSELVSVLREHSAFMVALDEDDERRADSFARAKLKRHMATGRASAFWRTVARMQRAREERAEIRRETSVLLFPSRRTGRYRSTTGLARAFETVRKALGIAFPVTPRAMRRTFQDLARLAAVEKVVTRSISGHATEQMQEHYSTAQAEEQRAGLAKVVSLFAVKERTSA